MKATVRIFCAALFLALTSCESYQTEQLALNQGKTLADLHYQMVLDNIAMARDYPGTIPWHAKFTAGGTVVQDTYTPSFTAGWLHIRKTAGLGAALQTQHTWTMAPMMSANLLGLLRPIYAKHMNDMWIRNGLPPAGSISGRFGTRYVWVANCDVGKLSTLVLEVLKQELKATVQDAADTQPAPPPTPTLSDMVKGAVDADEALRKKAGLAPDEDMEKDPVKKQKFLALKDLYLGKASTAKGQPPATSHTLQIITSPSPGAQMLVRP